MSSADYVWPTSEDLARFFHEQYERYAPDLRLGDPESAVMWEDVPRENRNLMITMAYEVLVRLRTGWYRGVHNDGDQRA